MKIYNYIIILLLLGVTFTACEDDEAVNMVYIPEAGKGGGQLTQTFVLSEEPHKIPINVSLVGGEYPTEQLSADNNVEVTITVDGGLVESYNVANNTSYALLPEGTYTLPNNVLIPKGSDMASDSLIIDGANKIDPFVTYILPVSIGKVNGGMAGSYQQTLYYLLTGTVPIEELTLFDRTNWEVEGFSTEEASGEGANNGRAIFALDNDPATFWHTQWLGGEPQPPHEIIIDMKESQLVHGIAWTPRDFWRGQPTNIKVEVSEDKVNWKNGGTLDNIPVSFEMHKMFLPTMQTGRYLKFIVLSTNENTWSTAVAEIGAL